MDSGFKDSSLCQRIEFNGFQSLDSGFAIFSRIPDYLSYISDSKPRDSGFKKQNFFGFWNPDSL